MADDANFCGGRLRLAAFLRVVEYDMPQRPSRLKRRIMPLVEELPVNAAACEPKGATTTTKASIATRIPQVLRAKVSSGRSRAPPRTRKRRLPVNGLALLRTTTSDGLPEPGDAHGVFTVPIMETDPIDDSQSGVSITQRQTEIALSSNGDLPQGCSLCPNTQPSKRLSAPGILPISAKSRPQPQRRSHPLADGFVGSELELVSAKKPQRRPKPAPRDLKPKFVVAGLDLACGLLPAPAVPCVDSSAAIEPCASALTNTTKHFEQLDKAKTQVETNQRRHQHEQAERREHAVESQLCNVTAPIRRESESSGSDVA